MKKLNIYVAGLMVAAVIVALMAVGPIRNVPAFAMENCNAKSALLMDYSTGRVLFAQNENERRPIASMVKIMTLNLIFEALEDGKLLLDEKIGVSENAAGMGGSQAFLESGDEYAADELIKSIVVASANDSCVAMAEYLQGSVEGFVAQMNEKAKQLGMDDTNFVNCTGLPADGQYSCAADAAKMFFELIGHEKFFEYAKVWMYDFKHPDGRVTELTNTNKLVRFYNGCDGGKTGYTSEAMSCLAATAKRGDTRLVSVVLAAPSAKERNAEISKLFNYGFANYETRKLVASGDETGEVAVDGGKVAVVKVCAEKDLCCLVKKGDKREIEYRVDLPDKVSAPIKSGCVVGSLYAYSDGEKVGEVKLITMSDVDRANYMDYIDKIVDNWN